MDSPRPASRRGCPPRSGGITANTPATAFPPPEPASRAKDTRGSPNWQPTIPHSLFDGQVLHLSSEHETILPQLDARDLPNRYLDGICEARSPDHVLRKLPGDRHPERLQPARLET